MSAQYPQLDAPGLGEINCSLGDDGVPTKGDTVSGNNSSYFNWTGTDAMCTRGRPLQCIYS